MCISVDLPEPDGPMIAVSPPTGRSTDTPSSAVTAAWPSPKTRRRSRALTMALLSTGAAGAAGWLKSGSFRFGSAGRREHRRRDVCDADRTVEGRARLGDQPAVTSKGQVDDVVLDRAFLAVGKLRDD